MSHTFLRILQRKNLIKKYRFTWNSQITAYWMKNTPHVSLCVYTKVDQAWDYRLDLIRWSNWLFSLRFRSPFFHCLITYLQKHSFQLKPKICFKCKHNETIFCDFIWTNPFRTLHKNCLLKWISNLIDFMV